MTTKERLHQLIDELPEDEMRAVEQFLAFLRVQRDPVLAAFLNAPYDDEPLTDEDVAAIEEAREEVRRGEVVPWETVRREFGLD